VVDKFHTNCDAQPDGPHRVRLAGVGFLAAALLDPDVKESTLDCQLSGSRPGKQACEKWPITVRNQDYRRPKQDGRWETRPIRFSLPYDQPAKSSELPGKSGQAHPEIRTTDAEVFPFRPWLLEAVDAHEVHARLES